MAHRERELIKIKWKTDFDKEVIIDNFIARKWTEVEDEEDDDWNMYWATVWNVRNIFKPGSGVRLNENQLLNHFPNHYELTRKDLMVKNIKRYRKEMEKEFNPIAAKDEHGEYLYLGFFPQTYILPAEYALFVEEFHRNPNLTWIVKPATRSQGKGIFLLSKINQLKKITSSPLGYSKGFGRFCNENFTTDITEIDNMFVHLTNVAIQKYSDKYNDKHGGKWTLQSLRFYIETTRGRKVADKMFDDIHNIIISSLKSVQSVIMNDKHCYEMYGYDILIDSACKPWLIEINASPSLTTTNKADKELKTRLLNDVFTIVSPQEWTTNEINRETIQAKGIKRVGDFSVLYDESQDQSKKLYSKRTGLGKIWR